MIKTFENFGKEELKIGDYIIWLRQHNYTIGVYINGVNYSLCNVYLTGNVNKKSLVLTQEVIPFTLTNYHQAVRQYGSYNLPNHKEKLRQIREEIIMNNTADKYNL